MLKWTVPKAFYASTMQVVNALIKANKTFEWKR
jgi:hypothetical protein